MDPAPLRRSAILPNVVFARPHWEAHHGNRNSRHRPSQTRFSTARRGSQRTCGASLQSRLRCISRDRSQASSTNSRHGSLQLCLYHWARRFMALGIEVRLICPQTIATTPRQSLRPQVGRRCALSALSRSSKKISRPSIGCVPFWCARSQSRKWCMGDLRREVEGGGGFS